MFHDLLRRVRALRRDTKGVSVVEFALMLPILMVIGAAGIELLNYVLANQKIERIASITADNIARNTLAPSERSFVDTFAGVDDIAAPFNMLQNGRVIITGVMGVRVGTDVKGKVVWQRCSGLLPGQASTVGKQATDPSKWAEGPDAKLPNNVAILQNQLVVVSEVAYFYRPLITLTELNNTANGKIVRMVSTYASRGQGFPNVTPSTGVTAATCS